ncbi:MAG: hypothetical protein US13_C0003G0001 [candidate division TM6 bacterium GW2011_GWE2_36_25]|nr:MAG: hypothetical protein US03_C0003G0001 [candidate division TM6 bacterium GW2011_GWF2_36_131]KKQ03320.1 MAG: hypothetical protein US13_C0003G0001 [candidate division TM6 bacterium GW2011_GWE2_36_25]
MDSRHERTWNGVKSESNGFIEHSLLNFLCNFRKIEKLIAHSVKPFETLAMLVPQGERVK